MDNTVYIMQGVPGSGKSTWIRNNVSKAFIVSADHFFMKKRTFGPSSYEFDPKYLDAAHDQCWGNYKLALALGIHPDIVVDNTNVTVRDIERYYNAAATYGYTPVVIRLLPDKRVEAKTWTAFCAGRNVHGVPLSSIDKMYARQLACVFPPDWLVRTYRISMESH